MGQAQTIRQKKELEAYLRRMRCRICNGHGCRACEGTGSSPKFMTLLGKATSGIKR